MTTLALVTESAPSQPQLPPLPRRIRLAAVCAVRVLRTGRTWQHDRLDGYREGMKAGISARPMPDSLPTRPTLTAISGGAR